MNKNWKKTGNGEYAFFKNGEAIGTLLIHLGSSDMRATASIDGKSFTIATKGFWKSSIIITDDSGNEILKVSPKKWYGTTYDVSHNGNFYSLTIRNNPLAEWALYGEKTLLSYGIDASTNKISIKLGGDTQEVIYDFLLWYLFQPIATEHTGDEFVFNLLLPAQ